MALKNRQRYLYTYKCDIYKQIQPPNETVFDKIGFPSVLTDFGTYSLSASGVPCLFWATPELAQSTEIGRTKTVFLQTMDRWKFTADVNIQDTDIIVCTYGPNNFSFVGYAWAVQGNTQTESTISQINSQLVYAKIINPPSTIPGVSGYYQ